MVDDIPHLQSDPTRGSKEPSSLHPGERSPGSTREEHAFRPSKPTTHDGTLPAMAPRSVTLARPQAIRGAWRGFVWQIGRSSTLTALTAPLQALARPCQTDPRRMQHGNKRVQGCAVDARDKKGCKVPVL